MTTTTGTAYRIDHDTDSDRASDGISRYSAYVRQNAGKFSWAFEERDAVEFAAVAFEIASSPIMSPGYVLDHPRILATRLSS
ncbi:hypothetical protein [Streptosporangium sp. NPDC006007]|uniref:hypothetical protein n=1 Tax=Streptosporangium sp. NPDC006007 TaxID=3154575 RepID=UPI0033A57623